MSKYNYNSDYFEVIDCANKAYWLGFLYADGCVSVLHQENKNVDCMHLEITLCKKDKKHLEKFRTCLESDVPIVDKIVKLNNKEYEECRLTISCTKMCRDLIKLGCIPKKTFSIRLPNDDIVPHEFKKDFIRGYFDGDGCICVSTMANKPHIEVTFSGTELMMGDISKYLVQELVIRQIPKMMHDSRSHGVSFFIYGEDTIKDFLDYLYKDSELYLDRKYLKYKEYYKNYKPIDKRGVYWSKENQAYVATIRINGKRIRLGQSSDLNEAIKMRKEAEIIKMNMKIKQPA